MTKWLLATWILGHSLDLSSTVVALDRGAIEANPLSSPAAKGAVALGGGLWLVRLHKEHPKAAWVVVGATTVANGFIAAHNLRQGR